MSLMELCANSLVLYSWPGCTLLRKAAASDLACSVGSILACTRHSASRTCPHQKHPRSNNNTPPPKKASHVG